MLRGEDKPATYALHCLHFTGTVLYLLLSIYTFAIVCWWVWCLVLGGETVRSAGAAYCMYMYNVHLHTYDAVKALLLYDCNLG